MIVYLTTVHHGSLLIKVTNFKFAAPTLLEVLLSPKDTQIKEYSSHFLPCIFRSSSKVNMFWERQGDLIPDGLQR